MRRACPIFVAALLAGCSTAGSDAGQEGPASARLGLSPCTLNDVRGPVLCGKFEVPENRDNPGRRLQLNIAVLKATGDAPKADPVVPLQGGPGQGSVHLANFYSRILFDIRHDRDIVLIDVRGTGESNPLMCDVASVDSLASGELLPPASIRDCRSALEKRADLRQYTTANIARDLDEVRQAMGIEKWNLYGASYGTRLALEYLRTFGAHVRTVTLKGIVPPSLKIPVPYARDAQTAAEKVLDAETRELLTAVLAQLRTKRAEIPGPAGPIVISEGLFAEGVRNQLYNPATADIAVAMIRDAASGQYARASQTIARVRRGFSSDIALGMFLSVTCTEDIPRIDPAAVPSAIDGTFVGDYRIRQQTDACKLWTAGPLPATAGSPVESNVPALLFSGDLDPVTPPHFGEEVLRTLPNARHIVIPGNGHAMGNSIPCVIGLMRELLDRAERPAASAGCT